MTTRTLPVIERNGMAFGVDPKRSQTFSLRQARYFEIMLEVQERFPDHFTSSPPPDKLKFLDIGVQNGVSKKYLELIDRGAIDYAGADLALNDELERPEDWTLYFGDFQNGYPEIPSNSFDVVICEQVIEHLPSYEKAMQAIERVAKPGGLIIIGVPIFPDGLHLIRRYVVPPLDKLLKRKKIRGHVQAFSRRSFVQDIKRLTTLTIEKTRGFRIVSGGVLRPLENKEWYWRANREIGRNLPGACIEIQVVATKPSAA
ncbi:MAG: class I SAM-dependent methyltransferase [Pseudomonadota bacterium]